MPELPEVETVRRGLEEALVNQPTITNIEFKRKDLRWPIPIKKIRTLIGENILTIERRAKYLLLRTKKGTLLSHLGMTGTWRIAPLGQEREHDHIYLYFSNGLRLAYRDPRRFGVFDFVEVGKDLQSRHLKQLGWEPLSSDFTGEVLWRTLRGKASALKVAIMNQKLVVGVGNIYASEALFRAGISPFLKANKLSRQRADQLVASIKEILTDAIRDGGSTISDYEKFSGEAGGFQSRFRVYGREGVSCVTCKTPIRAKNLGGRATYWCSKCQK